MCKSRLVLGVDSSLFGSPFSTNFGSFRGQLDGYFRFSAAIASADFCILLLIISLVKFCLSTQDDEGNAAPALHRFTNAVYRRKVVW